MAADIHSLSFRKLLVGLCTISISRFPFALPNLPGAFLLLAYRVLDSDEAYHHVIAVSTFFPGLILVDGWSIFQGPVRTGQFTISFIPGRVPSRYAGVIGYPGHPIPPQFTTSPIDSPNVPRGVG